MRYLYLLPLVAVIMPAAANAQTAPTPEQGQEMFAKVDTDHDGTISLDEWKAAGRRERGFKMIDTDGDGKLTPTELKTAVAKYRRGG